MDAMPRFEGISTRKCSIEGCEEISKDRNYFEDRQIDDSRDNIQSTFASITRIKSFVLFFPRGEELKILNPGFYFILSEEGGIGLNFKFAFNTNGEKGIFYPCSCYFLRVSTSSLSCQTENCIWQRHVERGGNLRKIIRLFPSNKL